MVNNINSKIIGIILALCLNSVLLGQDCETALEDALENHYQQHYEQVLGILRECPPENWVDKTSKILAYELLALTYSATDSIEAAGEAIHWLLDLQPGYTPQPPQYSTDFIKLVKTIKEVRARRNQRSVFRNKWFWLGGVAATSAAVFLISNQSNPPDALPEAPNPPGVQ